MPAVVVAVKLRMPCGANTSLSGGAYGFASVSSGRSVKNVLGRGWICDPTVNGCATKEEDEQDDDCLDPDEVNVMNIMKKNTSPTPNVSMSIPGLDPLDPLGPRLNLKFGIITYYFYLILILIFLVLLFIYYYIFYFEDDGMMVIDVIGPDGVGDNVVTGAGAGTGTAADFTASDASIWGGVCCGSIETGGGSDASCCLADTSNWADGFPDCAESDAAASDDDDSSATTGVFDVVFVDDASCCCCCTFDPDNDDDTSSAASRCSVDASTAGSCGACCRSVDTSPDCADDAAADDADADDEDDCEDDEDENNDSHDDLDAPAGAPGAGAGSSSGLGIVAYTGK